MNKYMESYQLIGGVQIEHISTKGWGMGDERVLNYIDTLSKEINSRDKLIREYPDLAAFSFWIRRASIVKMISSAGMEKHKLIGVGLAFHLAPSNVPLNFAYSWIFGLISGCANIVRLSSKETNEVDSLINIIESTLNNEQYQELRTRNSFIRYDKESGLTEHISKIGDARIIWGGDETVNRIKPMPTKTKCRDIQMTDRYSAILINAKELTENRRGDITMFVKNFWKDAMTFNQNACSSPKQIIWQGDTRDIDKARKVFWDLLAQVKTEQLEENEKATYTKYTKICIGVANKVIQPKELYVERNGICRILIKERIENIEEILHGEGYFVERCISKMAEIEVLATPKLQTLSYWGYTKEEINTLIENYCSNGIDRVVPCGRSLELSMLWDGHNMLGSLCRVIQKLN